MSQLDQRIGSAVNDLRRELDAVEPPPFKPNRPATPLVMLVFLLLGIGAVGYAVGTRTDESGSISVATQPEQPDEVDQAIPVTPQANLTDDPELGPDGEPAGQAVQIASTQQLTSAATGEYYVPIPGAVAWSPDNTQLLVYRTGAAQPGHLVSSVADPNADPIELPFVPADIEQIYWHPLHDGELLYTEGASVLSYGLETGQSRVEHRFDGCDRVDSGRLPVPPAADGTLSLLCFADGSVSQIVLDLATKTERRAETASDSAALPSPSGDRLVRWNPDGSATVLDRELDDTGVVLDLESNLFAFFTASDGAEWVAATLFDGPAVGTLVVVPLDGGDAVVLIGPEQGDAYPPTGNQIAAVGSRIVVSTRGVDDGAIAGNLNVVDVSQSFADAKRLTLRHQSERRVEFWSNPFVSISPNGRGIAYSSDRGLDAIDTFVVTVIDFPE